ncbi:pimeloyl-ACP methyl ester carboxylesterase [Bradyrhizobium sp. GM2.4]
MTNLAPTGFLSIGDASLEYKWLAPQSADAPTIVMLHEGLGSVGLWGDFPEKLREATSAGIFVYSRAGYGQSSKVALPRPLDYMQREALDVLPKILDAIGFRRGLLLGHSDGASIATIYAGAHQDHRLNGLVLIAPHFIVEDISVKSIADIKTAFETTDLKAKLARWHTDVDNAFYGWNAAWLDPKFRDWDISEYLAYIRVSRPDPSRRGRPIRDAASGRDRAARMLLPGRFESHVRRGAFSASRSSGSDASRD